MDLNELLRLWAEKEPERCKVGAGLPVVLLCGNWQALNNHRDQFGLSLPILEYALREAILARGWTYQTGGPMEDGQFGAIVYSDGYKISQSTHKEQAIALLRAYLQALGCEVDELVEVG